LDSRWPKLIFILLVLYAIVHFSYYYPQLPAVVASHFNERGAVNGWQTKSGFFIVLILASVIAAVVGFGIPRIMRTLPVEMINLPNKRFWLAPERAAETQEFLSICFAWFGCAVFLLEILAFDFAVQHNLHPQNPPAPAHMWYFVAGFLVFSLSWTIRMLAKFLRLPADSLVRK
jgi:uncharacterized membrane protein